MTLNQILVLVLVVFLTATFFIFINRKAYAFRFMYPGLVTFFFFMLIPIIFTIYIGFTNLSTGHILSKSTATDIIVSERFLPKEGKVLSYEIFNTKPLKIVVDRKYVGDLIFTEKAISLKLDKLPEGTPLSLHEVYQLREKINNIAFVIPGLEFPFFYNRTDSLAQLETQFVLIDDSTIQDRMNQKIYKIDNKKGFYSSEDGEKLSPGFFVNIGFKNFTSLFSDEGIRKSFGKVFAWTMGWSLFSVILTFTMGTMLALLLNDRALKLKPVYRVLLIIPYSIPFFISVLVFKGMYNKDFGIINEILSRFHFAAIPWLEEANWARLSCLIVNLWLGFPYMFLVVTGILQSIPMSVYEAAKLDGATRFQSFRFITLPMITSAVLPLLVGSFAFNLNNFVGIYLLTGGGPAIPNSDSIIGETDILISYTYRLAFEGGKGQDFGMASSIAFFIFIIIAILTTINFKLSGLSKDNKAK